MIFAFMGLYVLILKNICSTAIKLNTLTRLQLCKIKQCCAHYHSHRKLGFLGVFKCCKERTITTNHSCFMYVMLFDVVINQSIVKQCNQVLRWIIWIMSLLSRVKHLYLYFNENAIVIQWPRIAKCLFGRLGNVIYSHLEIPKSGIQNSDIISKGFESEIQHNCPFQCRFVSSVFFCSVSFC